MKKFKVAMYTIIDYVGDGKYEIGGYNPGDTFYQWDSTYRLLPNGRWLCTWDATLDYEGEVVDAPPADYIFRSRI